MSEPTIIYCDGGARHNPGPAGVGIVILHGDGEVIGAGTYIGKTTNNVAEYCGFIWALENAQILHETHIKVHADSQLIVNQLNGSYKCKDAKLKRLCDYAKTLMESFAGCTVVHVPRAENERADELANQAIDAKTVVGNPMAADAVIKGFVDELNASLFDIGESDTAASASDTSSDADAQEHAREMVAHSLSSKGIYSLTVKSHFDAAHHLYGYPGECKDLHGHTWDVEVTIEGEQLNDIGIVYDFKDLKSDLASVLKAFDHKLINEIAPFDILSPTAENLARILFEDLQVRIDKSIRVAEVAVWESPIARVGYRLTD